MMFIVLSKCDSEKKEQKVCKSKYKSSWNINVGHINEINFEEK